MTGSVATSPAVVILATSREKDASRQFPGAMVSIGLFQRMFRKHIKPRPDQAAKNLLSASGTRRGRAEIRIEAAMLGA